MINSDLYLYLDPRPPLPGEHRPYVGFKAERQRLMQEIHEAGTIAVAGPPGCGKSSLLSFASEKVKTKRKTIRICSSDSDPSPILSQIPKALPRRASKTFLVLDDLDKGSPEGIQNLLIRLRPLFETKGLASCVSIPAILGEQLERGISGEAPAPLLGVFSHMFRLLPMPEDDLCEILKNRLAKAGFEGGIEGFVEREALRLALAASRGSCRRWLHILKEGAYRAGRAEKAKLSFNEIFDVMAEPAMLDLTFKRILFMLAKKEKIQGHEKDVLEFTALDRKSLHRRLDLLVEKKIAELRSPSPETPSQEYFLRPTAIQDLPAAREKVSPEETGFETMHS